MAIQELYDRDFFEWTQRNADLLNKGCFDLADIPHIAEELADLGKSNQREVLSFLTRLILHLLKWQFQPSQQSGSWAASIDDSRVQLERIFEQSPSLRRYGAGRIEGVYPDAVRRAAHETGLAGTVFPPHCPYTFDQLMDQDFLPKT
ncbi:MAG: DUF29 domain-containing protein [Bryobacterales bacterium]|nr:DUF29 domain-containing protein [Bryobacterales bacterium]